MTFELIQSTPVYQGRAFSVTQDQVRLPDGKNTTLDIVAHIGSVALVPVDAQGRIWFVRQYRHAARKSMLELPAGTLEPGELPDEAARREIREEIGMAAGKLQKVGQFYLAPGYSTELMHIYLATDLKPDPIPGDEDEFLSAESYPAPDVFRMVAQGEIQDAKSLAALMLAGSILQR